MTTIPKRKRCKQCKQLKRVTLYSLGKNKKRNPICRACNYDGLTAQDKHTILREAYRNYLTWQDLLTYGGGSDSPVTDREAIETITYSIPKSKGSTEYVPISISFYDLDRALKTFKGEVKRQGTVLSKRKEQAFYLNVIRDMLQRDVADIMGITTVSVGQYVDQSCIQLAKYYFQDDNEDVS
jgi:hypothetical protein